MKTKTKPVYQYKTLHTQKKVPNRNIQATVITNGSLLFREKEYTVKTARCGKKKKKKRSEKNKKNRNKL